MEPCPDVIRECTLCGGDFVETAPSPATSRGSSARCVALCAACVSATAQFSLVG
ncbi:hypothetical protein SAMN06264364_110121 [Quadrisphaera granulorum]|uniref:Uncharacterized protein n=1 Tax=Quadrisphaera granulorum TaxID=317664 RepID=A0A316A9K1_9ACTN|nr:hypothetical protein BXY45_110121 [Quadrisphaera granulorum]SZE96635.1 hypothetical protein SAMN06264364_110121 [Quadrisphaera granulorum]